MQQHAVILGAIIEKLDKSSPDYSHHNLVLTMAKDIVDAELSEDDAEFEYKNSILKDASEILSELTRPVADKATKQPDPAYIPHEYQYTNTQRVIHEHRHPFQENLTSWMLWVMIPFVVAFLAFFGLMLH